MDIASIQDLCKQKKLRWTNHIFVRLVQRNISVDDVCSAIMAGEIIEEYTKDYPYPSCLILGNSGNKESLHILCGLGEGELWLITAYRPDQAKWSDDLKTRKESLL